jgi:hypothetical protein
MARDLTVNNQTFSYPDSGESPNWGEDATEWDQAVTDVLSGVQGINDIPETSFALVDTATILTNITGLTFDITTTRAAFIAYSVIKTAPSVLVEMGNINIIYDGSGWIFSRDVSGDANIDFNITAAGQVQYKTNEVGFAGTMKFSTIKVLTQ